MDISILFSADGVAAIALAAVIISAIVSYAVLLRMERPDTILPIEHRHVFDSTSRGLTHAEDPQSPPSCNGHHDWKILYEEALPDDSSLITFWCRHCGALTLQRDDMRQLHTSTVWKYDAGGSTQGRPLLLLHTLPNLPMSWDFATGALTLIDTESKTPIVFTPLFHAKKEKTPQ